MVSFSVMSTLRRDSTIQGFTLLELVVVIALVSLLISFSVPSLIKYSRSQDSKSLSSHITLELQKIYATSRRFSAFCNVYFTVPGFYNSLSATKLDLITSVKRSSGRVTYSPLIARCSENPQDIISGSNLLYNENIINSLPSYLFIALNKTSFGFTPRGLSNGSLDSLIVIGQRSSSPSLDTSFCIKVSAMTGKITSGIYHHNLPNSVRSRSHSFIANLRPDECY